MADVDKSLPNVEQEIKVPSPEELEISEKEEQQKYLDATLRHVSILAYLYPGAKI